MQPSFLVQVLKGKNQLLTRQEIQKRKGWQVFLENPLAWVTRKMSHGSLMPRSRESLTFNLPGLIAGRH